MPTTARVPGGRARCTRRSPGTAANHGRRVIILDVPEVALHRQFGAEADVEDGAHARRLEPSVQVPMAMGKAAATAGATMAIILTPICKSLQKAAQSSIGCLA